MAEFTALAEIALRIAAALLFLVAGWSKLRGVRDFQILLDNYQLLPKSLVALAARALPALELLLGIALILGMDRPEPALAAAGLLLVFAAAMAINLWRGRAFIECGCRPGAAPQARLKWGPVLRNLALAAAMAMGASAVTIFDPAMFAIGALAGTVLFVLDHIFAALGDLPSQAAVRP
jgi:uncharacterized membrane protein YphA (DoxX/SURF4 family)